MQAAQQAATLPKAGEDLSPKSPGSSLSPKFPSKGVTRADKPESQPQLKEQETSDRSTNGSKLGISLQEDAGSIFDDFDFESHPISTSKSQV